MPAKKEEFSDSDVKALQKVLQIDSFNKIFGPSKTVIIIFIAVVVLFIGTVATVGYFANRTINEMHREYIRDTEQIILTRRNIELANSWERLPINQQRERLIDQYYTIVKYYTNSVTDNQKMNDDQVVASFNVLWDCTTRIPSINFFLPIAYMKVATNFNPVYNVDWKRGIAAFYIKGGEAVANLPLVRNDQSFQTAYKGVETLNNPNEAIKLLVARIDDLMTTFNNRVDWVVLALYTNEYDVISKYWKGGEGKIPDDFYKKGPVAETLDYYYSFKNWQIPALPSE